MSRVHNALRRVEHHAETEFEPAPYDASEPPVAAVVDAIFSGNLRRRVVEEAVESVQAAPQPRPIAVRKPALTPETADWAVLGCIAAAAITGSMFFYWKSRQTE
jgi:hypothetical protein